MSSPVPSDLHVDQALTNLSVAWIQRQTNWVADRIFPSGPVQKQSDVYYELPRGAFNRSEMRARAPGAPARSIGYNMATQSYRCETYALSHLIPDESRANADAAVNLDMQGTELLTQNARLHREIQWASTYFAASVWTTDVTGVAATPTGPQVLQWNDANSTPIEDVRKYKTQMQVLTGFRANKMVLGRQVFDKLCDHPDVVDRVKYGQTQGGPARANVSVLAQLFEMDEIVVADALQNTGKEGLTDSYSFVIGKGALLVYAAPAPGLMIPSAGYTFNWVNPKLNIPNTMGTTIQRSRHPDPTAKSDLIWIEDAFVFKKVSADLGVYFATIVA